MRLSSLVRALESRGLLVRAPAADPELAGVTDDSRRVRPGFLFCAVEGTARDGHDFVAEAVVRGACGALVVREIAGAAVPQVVVRDSRSAASMAAAEWHGRPADALRTAAVTGTNGKTTTVALMRHLLGGLGPAGSIGTLGAFGADGQPLEGFGGLTTPGAVEAHAVFAALRDGGVRFVAMEASSHALDQRRLEEVPLAAAVYTNLTHEHLDYHGTMEAYRDAKLGLSRLLTPEGVEIVNADDPAWLALAPRDGIRRVTYGRAAGAQMTVDVTAADASGTNLRLRTGEGELEAYLPLPGDFNVTNALAAAATAWALEMAPETIVDRLSTAPPVPGRLERVGGDAFAVFRDYAHTPDALERAIAALRPLTPGRLIVLFGAGGDRDRTKRPLMGAVAAGDADLAVVTSDNPRSEDPDAIIDEIEAGMVGVEHLRITDRRRAIAHALGILGPGDTLLLAGKGHETHQIVGTTYRDFDERAIVRDLLGEGGGA